MDHTPGISLNKYISDRGICSRREATRMIASGKVTINGMVARPGNRVFSGDMVCLEGEEIGKKPKRVYIILNKPEGIVCTTDTREPENIIDFIGLDIRLFPVGRLDKASRGLILLTNDGDIVNKILRAGNNHVKVYQVKVDKSIDESFLEKMRSGIPILGTVTKKCKVTKIGDKEFEIVLTQGLNRQIRRMCEYLGYRVRRLERIKMMNLEIRRLRLGEWRYLKKAEIEELKYLIRESSGTMEQSFDSNRKSGYSKRKYNKSKK